MQFRGILTTLFYGQVKKDETKGVAFPWNIDTQEESPCVDDHIRDPCCTHSSSDNSVCVHLETLSTLVTSKDRTYTFAFIIKLVLFEFLKLGSLTFSYSFSDWEALILPRFEVLPVGMDMCRGILLLVTSFHHVGSVLLCWKLVVCFLIKALVRSQLDVIRWVIQQFLWVNLDSCKPSLLLDLKLCTIKHSFSNSMVCNVLVTCTSNTSKQTILKKCLGNHSKVTYFAFSLEPDIYRFSKCFMEPCVCLKWVRG